MYRRKVHCRYCGETGHNRNGCSKLKEYINANPNSWQARQYKAHLENAKNRSCSYCKESGHNRKTCNMVMNDMVEVAAHNTNFRRAFVKMCKEKGLGVGALVKIPEWSGYENGEYKRYENALALVTDIHFNVVKMPTTYGSCCPFVMEFCSIKDYNGVKNEKYTPDMPNWSLAGFNEKPGRKHDSYHSEYKFPFEVVSPGYFMIEDEEKWIRDADTVRSIVMDYNGHDNLMHRLDNQKLPL